MKTKQIIGVQLASGESYTFTGDAVISYSERGFEPQRLTFFENDTITADGDAQIRGWYL